MSKTSTTFICQQCNYQSPSYLGKCPNCDSWGSLVETVTLSRREKLGSTTTKLTTKPQRLSDATQKPYQRVRSGISELDRVLGGGIVPGSGRLRAGAPGIGKSTLLLQLSSALRTLYVSGEESGQQVRIRFDRLGQKGNNLLLFTETDVDDILAAAKEVEYQILVVDLIQNTVTNDLISAA